MVLVEPAEAVVSGRTATEALTTVVDEITTIAGGLITTGERMEEMLTTTSLATTPGATTTSTLATKHMLVGKHGEEEAEVCQAICIRAMHRGTACLASLLHTMSSLQYSCSISCY